MMVKVIALLLALSVAPAATLTVDFTDSAWKEKPIQKVVNLLKEMQAQIEKEAAADEEMFEKMGCWCETNDREKTAAIEANTQRQSDLEAAVPMYAAKAAQLDVDIKQLKKEVAAASAALEEATEIRAKEQEEFRADEKETVASLTNLKRAVDTIGKLH